MSNSVALIRAVGGKTAMKMADLKAALSSAGLNVITTLQVAGNVVFDPAGASPDDSAELVHRAILDAFGHDLAVVIRTHEELVAAVARNPYAGSQDGKWIHTMSLVAPPKPALSLAIDHAYGAPDEFVIDGADIFLRFDSGVANSKLLTSWFERRLEVVGTARNANTMAKLVDLTA